MRLMRSSQQARWSSTGQKYIASLPEKCELSHFEWLGSKSSRRSTARLQQRIRVPGSCSFPMLYFAFSCGGLGETINQRYQLANYAHLCLNIYSSLINNFKASYIHLLSSIRWDDCSCHTVKSLSTIESPRNHYVTADSRPPLNSSSNIGIRQLVDPIRKIPKLYRTRSPTSNTSRNLILNLPFRTSSAQDGYRTTQSTNRSPCRNHTACRQCL
jgi:hypothetical protein